MKDSRNYSKIDAKLLRKKIKKIVYKTTLMGLFLLLKQFKSTSIDVVEITQETNTSFFE